MRCWEHLDLCPDTSHQDGSSGRCQYARTGARSHVYVKLERRDVLSEATIGSFQVSFVRKNTFPFIHVSFPLPMGV